MVISASEQYSKRVDVRHVIDRLTLKYGPVAYIIHQAISILMAEFPPTLDDVQEHLDDIAEAKLALADLIARPTIKQRTPEWYEARMGMITASDFAQALGAGKFGTQKQLIWKKCMPSSDDWASLANCPPIKWGCMYEDVAQQIYCRRNKVVMHEFGLVKHPTVDHLGASPDGISELGVMLEIKCPYKREITGEVPLQYYYQIQGQLLVCGLKSCDFLELGFKELPRDAFYEKQKNERGIVVEIFKDGGNTYVYSGVDWDREALEAFEHIHRQDTDFVKFHYWRVNVYSCVRITRDVDFVEKMVPEIRSVWARIEAYRKDEKLMEDEIGLPPLPEKKKRKEYVFRDVKTTTVIPTTIPIIDEEESPKYAFR